MKYCYWILLSYLVISCADSSKPEQPNILIIYSDEFPPDYIDLYGGKIPMPNLQKLAEDGTVFDNAYTTAPMCTPSRFSLLTGLYPGRSTSEAFVGNIKDGDPYVVGWNSFLDSTQASLGKRLKEEGYLTGMSGKWHVSDLKEVTNQIDFYQDGDIRNDSTLRKMSDYLIRAGRKIGEDGWFDLVENPMPGNADQLPLPQLHAHHIEWQAEGTGKLLDMASNGTKPFFFYVTPTALHGPNHYETLKADARLTPTGWRSDFARYNVTRDSVYATLSDMDNAEQFQRAGLFQLDWYIGEVVRQLKATNQYENTLIVFASDHGVEPGKSTCYERGLRIPMVIKWPADINTESETRSSSLVQNIDIATTIYDVLNLNEKTDGKSLLPIATNPNKPIRDYIYAEAGYSRAIITKRNKYIATRYPNHLKEQWQDSLQAYAPNHLGKHKQGHAQIAMQHYPDYFSQDQYYDLKNDPYEQNNQYASEQHTSEVKELREVLRNYTNELPFSFDLDHSLNMTSHLVDKARNTKAIGTDYIPWLERDHRRIVWPPLGKK